MKGMIMKLKEQKNEILEKEEKKPKNLKQKMARVNR